MKKLTIDFETRSAAPIKKVGAAAYAEHPTTEVICLALKPEGGSAVIWYSPDFAASIAFGVNDHNLPLVTDADVVRMLSEADIIEAHNAQFEYFIWKYVMPRYGFLPLDSSKLRCSAAKAATFGLPRDLAGACRAAGVAQQKDTEGSRLMLKMCKPRRPRKSEMLSDPDYTSKLYWYEDPADLVRLGQYCLQDVIAEESFSQHLPELPPAEQALWQLDLEINDRGIKVDTDSVRDILECVDKCASRQISEFQNLTGLNSPRQRDAVLNLLLSLGEDIQGLSASDVEKALTSTDNETARRILEIRQSVCRSSTAKYQTFAEAVCSDDRIRGALMYHGAGTGRWTGRIIQPQNFPRGAFSDVEPAIQFFRNHDLDSVEMLYGDPMVAASTCLRGMITPSDGCDLVCADYSSIEGRVLAWLAGEESALDVYREGRDPYKVAAAAIYHVNYADVTKPQRQIGKVAELALGYQGGIRAFDAMAANYGVALPETEIQSIVEKWREARPCTTRFWRELEAACFDAVSNPGVIMAYRGIKFVVRGRFLAMRLPSGRCLWYANPRLEDKEMSWGGTKKVVAYDGVNSVTRKWSTQYLYGGLLAENATQATARDLLVAGMFAVTEAGYDIVMHVHDELVAEAKEGFGSVEEFEKLMCSLPDWASGLPIKAEGWRGKRYRK
jgi:DNA polymerase